MASQKETAVLTVAAVRDTRAGEEILFNERQQIFTVAKTTKAPAGMSAPSTLRAKLKANQPVKVRLDPKKGIVESIADVSPTAANAFAADRTLLEDPAKPVKLELRKIDPTIFDIADFRLKWPAFLLCSKTIPSYAKAKEIFDYCAAQTCSLGGPFGVTPCIPFQYVRDGCYARAHKMRWIITTKYKYCVEKVFSFANVGNDRLAVRANKWGGCCVTWWYHVAPLVRVNVKIFNTSFQLAMVIDPGMFDQPVLLSTWLSAQETVACSANANVSMYSIQPGSAYSPANYAGTAFTTDPSYTSTDATCIAYKNLTTCP